MKNKNKYWISSLYLIISFSLVLQFCCHAHSSELFSPHQETHNHTTQQHHSKSSDCSCGHEIGKDFQKPDKAVGNQNLLPSLETVSFDDLLLQVFKPYQNIDLVDNVSSYNFAPSLYLLNSVFLN